MQEWILIPYPIIIPFTLTGNIQQSQGFPFKRKEIMQGIMRKSIFDQPERGTFYGDRCKNRIVF
jgi:hypothetical protein